MKILLVEDNEELANIVAEHLRRDAYAVDIATTGSAAAELADVNDYDAVILDWVIPSPSGLELLRRWRNQNRETPVLMLTGRSNSRDIVKGLDSGADDYLTKPFTPDELLARLRSILRRRSRRLVMSLRAGDVILDRSTHRVRVEQHEVHLSPTEFALLEYLLTRKDEVVSRGEITEHVWDSAADSFSNFVDVAVHRLRKKIDGERDNRLLHSVRGVGFVLSSERH